MAQERLAEAKERLDSLSHLPEGDPELTAALACWRTANVGYGAVCAALSRDA